MATIHVDGKAYEVNGADNLLQACLSLGLDIPYFCWHPAMGSVGSCRQCAVKQYKDENDTQGRIVMSCMTPSSNGTYISIDDEDAKKFRETVIEFLMLNHPHDCPVCEEGGNCHLQDMTVMSGHMTRRSRFPKKTHNNQYLGPFINHEMNRCIACYRCVHYYKDYAGGTDLGVFGAHDNVYFGRHEDGVLESEFSGNLIEVCPTGVFTDKTHSKRYNRKWDMQYAPSICQQCSVGCNISPGERYGELRRIENRFNGEVNHYFLCDRGRFGYGYVNLKDRPRQPQRMGENGVFEALNIVQTMHEAVEMMKDSKRIIGIGSPRASVESNYALRALVGEENYFSGIDQAESSRLNLLLDVMQKSGVYTPSLREIEDYDAVLVLGEDVTQTGARIALAIRQAIKGKAREMAGEQRIDLWQIAAVQTLGQHAKYPLFVTNVDRTRLDDVAAWSYFAGTNEQAEFGFAIAAALDANAPQAQGLGADLQQKVKTIAQALKGAKKPLIVTGSSAGSDAVIQAASNIVLALKQQGSDVGLVCVPAEANSMGVAMMGGKSLDVALDLLEQGGADTVIVLENDLYRRASSKRIDSVLEKIKRLVVIDHQRTTLMEKAQLVISSASFAESDGTLINNEGRAQRFFQVYDPAYFDRRPVNSANELIAEEDTNDKRSLIYPAWRWLSMIRLGMQNNGCMKTIRLDGILKEFAKDVPHMAAVVDAAQDSHFRIKGMKIARQPSRYSGRTSMRADISVHEPAQPSDEDTALTFSTEGYSGADFNYQQIPFVHEPGWNSSQAWNRFQDEVGGHLRAGDPGKRMIEPAQEVTLSYYQPANHKAQDLSVISGQWQVAPYYHLFGSEELSQRSEVIQERMPSEVYVVLSQADAQALQVVEGDKVCVECADEGLVLKVLISANLQAGLVGLPLGLPGIPPILNGQRVHRLQRVAV